MVLCKYYLRGHCKFGRECHNIHPAGKIQFGYDFGRAENKDDQGSGKPMKTDHTTKKNKPYEA